MVVDKEPKVTKKRLPIRGNPMKPNQITGYTEVSSGPLPTSDELPPLDGTGEETVVEGVGGPISKRSSQFPADEPLQRVPTKGAITED